MDKKVLVIGAGGALGSDLMKVFPNVSPAQHEWLDICDLRSVREFLTKSEAKYVINTAAFHNVPVCEEQRERSFQVNAIGAANLAKVCQSLKIHLCHISTDYVFDGEARQPYKESDLPSPLSTYGISKLAGEHMVAAYCDDYSIVRSCGLYGRVPSRVKGGNFITTMIRLGRQRETVSVVKDEIVTPTCTRDLALGIKELLISGGKGLFHITQTGASNWYDFAKIIFKHYMLPAKLEAITTQQFQSTVNRPQYSILDNTKYNQLTGKPLAPWDEALKRHLDSVSRAPSGPYA